MSQDSVLKILSKNKKWMTSRQITKALKNEINHSTVITNLKKIYKSTDSLERKNVANEKGYGLNYIWRIKSKKRSEKGGG